MSENAGMLILFLFFAKVHESGVLEHPAFVRFSVTHRV